MNDGSEDDDRDYEDIMEGGNSVGNLTGNRIVLVLWGVATLAFLIYILL